MSEAWWLQRLWVNDCEAAQILGFRNVQTLRNWRHEQRGPIYSKLGKSVRYKVSDLLEFAESHKVKTNG
jgi:hypothetical protein